MLASLLETVSMAVIIIINRRQWRGATATSEQCVAWHGVFLRLRCAVRGMDKTKPSPPPSI